jgi:hypothetical protein
VLRSHTAAKQEEELQNFFRTREYKYPFAHRTQYKIYQSLSHKQINSRSGIYQIKCFDCPLKYIGQTGRTFNIRYKEHIHDIRSSNSNSGYSNHILNTGHTYGIIADTMVAITTGREGKHLNTLERYHIYKISRDNIHMNHTCIDTHNPIFEALHEIYTR